MQENKIRVRYLLLLQLGVIIYSTASVIGKVASGRTLFSFSFLILYAVEFIVLALYAILWQQMLKHLEISVAYANRSMALLWSTIWAPLIFHETITRNNMIGVALVIVGTIMINMNPDAKEEIK